MNYPGVNLDALSLNIQIQQTFKKKKKKKTLITSKTRTDSQFTAVIWKQSTPRHNKTRPGSYHYIIFARNWAKLLARIDVRSKFSLSTSIFPGQIIAKSVSNKTHHLSFHSTKLENWSPASSIIILVLHFYIPSWNGLSWKEW